MSAHTRGRRTGVWPLAAVTTVAVLVSCSSTDDAAGLSVSGLRDTARSATDSCPVHWDLDKAAARADVHSTSEPDEIDAELDDDAADDSALGKAGGATLDCDYRLGRQTVTVRSIAVEHGHALYLTAPSIAVHAELTSDQLGGYLDKALKSGPDSPVLTPDHNVASAVLPVEGDGDIALVITFSDDPHHNSLSRHQVKVMARELASQAEW